MPFDILNKSSTNTNLKVRLRLPWKKGSLSCKNIGVLPGTRMNHIFITNLTNQNYFPTFYPFLSHFHKNKWEIHPRTFILWWQFIFLTNTLEQ